MARDPYAALYNNPAQSVSVDKLVEQIREHERQAAEYIEEYLSKGDVRQAVATVASMVSWESNERDGALARAEKLPLSKRGEVHLALRYATDRMAELIARHAQVSAEARYNLNARMARRTHF